MRILVCLFGALILFVRTSSGQSDSIARVVAQFPNRIFARINSKASSLDNALTKQTEKYLRRLARKERKIQEKLYKIDSNAAKNLFNGTQERYTALQQSMSSGATVQASSLSGEYLPYIDSTKCSLQFAQQHLSLMKGSPQIQQEINSALTQFNKLQYNLDQTDQIKAYLQQRKQMFQDELMRYSQQTGLKKYIDDYNSEQFYYFQQVKDYKEALNDPDKMLQKALIILNKLPVFQNFIKHNSQLAGLFSIPDNYSSTEAVSGLQTRDQVQQLLNGQISAGGAGGMSALQSNLETAHDQLDQYKDKLSSLGVGGGDVDMPNFKPNKQKTRSFLKRLELGVNLQTTRANWYFPSTTNVGLSIGYKLSDKNIIGIGSSYNIGWGTNINHIKFTSQGLSLRSFIDIEFKKNLFISAGYEENYVQPFTSISQLQVTNRWQKSGLVGLSKIVSLPGKLVKKTKVSLLWDYLSYSQVPKSQPILFRLGYNF